MNGWKETRCLYYISPFIGDEQVDVGYHSDKCIIVKVRVLSEALGGPWEVLYLSQGSISKGLAKSGTHLMCQ